MNTSKAIIPRLANLRQFGTSAVKKATKDLEVDPGYKKTWSKYKHYQKADGIPVHLKNGLPDKILYYGTIVGIIGSLGYGGTCVYPLMFPKKD